MVRNSSLEMKEYYLHKILDNPSTRKWQVWKFNGPPRNIVRDGEKLRKLLLEKLEQYFLNTISVKVVERNNALWSQVSVLNTKDFYLVYHPHSLYLFLTSMTVKYKEFLRQALQNVFDVEKGIKALSIEGKDIGKLADLALNQLSQGAFNAYREFTNLFENNPLESHESLAKRRRLALHEENQDKFEKEQRKTLKEIQADTSNRQLIKETEERETKKPYSLDTLSKEIKISGNSDQSAKITAVCARLRSCSLYTIIQRKAKSFRPNRVSEETCNDFFCYVKFEGRHVMRGLDALYPNSFIRENKQLPLELEASELLRTSTNHPSSSELPNLIEQKLVPIYLKSE